MYRIRSTVPLSSCKQRVKLPRLAMSALSASLATLSLVAIAPSFSISALAQIYRPPNRGTPASTEGAGTRGSSCVALSEKNKLKPLIPTGNIGLTVSEHPTFFGYIPKSDAKAGEFVLRDQNNQLIYRTRFALPSQAGIVSISVPPTRSLALGKMYQWSFVLVCDLSDRSNNEISPPAWIERIQPSQTLTERIKNATPETLPAVYADAGIWYDALASRVKLFPSQPQAQWQQNWEQLLTTAGLQAFISEPLVEQSSR